MKAISTFIKILQKLSLILLFAATLNLSLQVSLPTHAYTHMSTESSFDQQEICLLPFREKESAPTTQSLCNLQTIVFTALLNPWLPLTKPLIRQELFFKQNIHSFKEFPFIVLVHKLRI